eukprot:Transcript_29150.p2 GENE.Transcript_29150~~Transcript_29150.p2  ORF type:complete len:681 (+),score=272.71 Transcript_29150:274-2043(+)
MCGLLSQYGYRLVGEAQRGDADLWLINTCTVKNPSQEHMQTDISRGKAAGKPVVVAGCVSQAEPGLQALQGLSIVGVQQLERVVEVVQESLRGHTVQLLERRERPSLDLPKVRRNQYVEIIPVNTGCLGSCTYCKTVFARGRLGSYEPAALVARLRGALGEGVKEVWLTSEDTGAYGRDIGSSMPEMMEVLLNELPEGAMLRVGMTNPPYMLEHLPAIARLLRHPRCYAFLHVPVQSGSNAVLGAMRREYTVEQFMQVADALMEAVPELTLATDIIAGFPGESDEDHQATLRLVRRYKFSQLHISQFYPRPGTPAAKMRRVATHVVKERTRDLTAVFNSYSTLGPLVGTQQRVLATDLASDKKHLVAHTKGYVQVLLPLRREWLGCTLLVAITQAAKFHVRGDVLRVLIEASGEVVPARPNVTASDDESEEDVPDDRRSDAAHRTAPPDAPAEAARECCGGGCGGGVGGGCAEQAAPGQGTEQAPAEAARDCCGGGCGGGRGAEQAGGGDAPSASNAALEAAETLQRPPPPQKPRPPPIRTPNSFIHDRRQTQASRLGAAAGGMGVVGFGVAAAVLVVAGVALRRVVAR